MSNSNKKTKPSAKKRAAARRIGLRNTTELEAARSAQQPKPAGTPLNQPVPRPKVDYTGKAKGIIERGQPLRRKVGDDTDE